jgi:hypothetical protein
MSWAQRTSGRSSGEVRPILSHRNVAAGPKACVTRLSNSTTPKPGSCAAPPHANPQHQGRPAVDGLLRFPRPTSNDHLAAQIVTLVPFPAVQGPPLLSYERWAQERGNGRSRDGGSRSRLRSVGALSADALGCNRLGSRWPLSRCRADPRRPEGGDDGRHHRRAARSGLAVAGPDGRGPRALVLLGPPRQPRPPKRPGSPSRVARPRPRRPREVRDTDRPSGRVRSGGA